MDLTLSEEQELLRTFAREFLEKECPESYVREMEDDTRGYAPAFWRQVAEQGWLGLAIPKEYGGSGLGFLDLTLLVEEFGRALVPGPFVPTSLATIAILEAGSDGQKAEYLPPIASGDQVWGLAFTEESARFDAAGVQLSARRDGDGCVLNGRKLFVRDAQAADQLVVVARTGGAGEDGVSLFAVDAKSAGISISSIPTIGSEKENEVRFEGVRVPAANLLGREGGGWPAFRRIASKATILEAAYLVGIISQAFDITLEYTKQRVQFGRPIASFQAIQHKASELILDVDSSRYITYKAAMAIDDGEADAEVQVSIAKAWVSSMSRRVVAEAVQMHGGIGYTRDYKIQLYFRRQKACEVAWGDADFHRDRVASALGV